MTHTHTLVLAKNKYIMVVGCVKLRTELQIQLVHQAFYDVQDLETRLDNLRRTYVQQCPHLFDEPGTNVSILFW
jgi:hypothetical protein